MVEDRFVGAEHGNPKLIVGDCVESGCKTLFISRTVKNVTAVKPVLQFK